MYDFEILYQCGERVELKFKKFSGLSPAFVEVTGEKPVASTTAHYPE